MVNAITDDVLRRAVRTSRFCFSTIVVTWKRRSSILVSVESWPMEARDKALSSGKKS